MSCNGPRYLGRLTKGRVPTAMRQADKVKALVEAGVQRVQVQEQLGISKASYYRCLNLKVR